MKKIAKLNEVQSELEILRIAAVLQRKLSSVTGTKAGPLFVTCDAQV